MRGEQLGPCPRCGKLEGLLSVSGARFSFMVYCQACGFTTEPAKIKGVALKLWNEAKPAKEKAVRSNKKARARRA
jgi:hypothetical protein